jgi:hypothetical protein
MTHSVQDKSGPLCRKFHNSLFNYFQQYFQDFKKLTLNVITYVKYNALV